MSHEIETHGDQAAFVSARLDAWHRLGTTLDHQFTAQEALTHAHLGGWNVRKVGIAATELTENGVESIEVPDRFAIVRNNPFTGAAESLGGVVSEQYQPVQNEEHIEFLNALVDNTGAHLETAGSLHGGKRVFVTCKLPEGMNVGGVDQVDTYLSVINGHDGNSSFQAMVSPVRIVCANTLNAALAEQKQSWKVRHTTNAKSSIEEARQALELSWAYSQQFEAEAERMIQETLAPAEWDRTLERLFGKPDPENTTVSGRNHIKKLDTIRGLYSQADTQENCRGTRWAAYNAITEYADHFSNVRGEGKEEKRALRAIDSELVRVKQEAFRLLRVAA